MNLLARTLFSWSAAFGRFSLNVEWMREHIENYDRLKRISMASYEKKVRRFWLAEKEKKKIEIMRN